jgi:hypothetical protein
MSGAVIQLNREHKQAYFLQLYHMVMLFLALNYEVILGRENFDFIHLCKMAFWAILYNFNFRTLYRLDLYFWLFSTVVGIYLAWSLFLTLLIGGSYILFYMYITANVALWLELYMMSSPIFFPRTAWWEYDFRYRPDLKISVELHQGSQVDSYTGRMTDIRRQAACVVLFQDIPIKKQVILRSEDNGFMVELKAQIISKREYSFGRGITYGVKVLLSNNDEKKIFKSFSKQWINNHREKQKVKFTQLIGSKNHETNER